MFQEVEETSVGREDTLGVLLRELFSLLSTELHEVYLCLSVCPMERPNGSKEGLVWLARESYPGAGREMLQQC